MCRDGEAVGIFRYLWVGGVCLACQVRKDAGEESLCRFREAKGDHLLMPSMGSAGDPLALPHLPEQPQALNPGPHKFLCWPSSLHPSKPCSDFSQRSTLTPGTPITCALFSTQHHSLLQTFIKCPLQVPATCHLPRDPESWQNAAHTESRFPNRPFPPCHLLSLPPTSLEAPLYL